MRIPRLMNKNRQEPSEDSSTSLAVSDGEELSSAEVAAERKEAISRGRKHVIPLAFSINKIAKYSAIFLVVAALILSVFVWRLMYVQKSTSDISYAIARVLPLNVASVDGLDVKYNSYLFELRTNTHFLSAQEKVDFVDDESGRNILDGLKQQSMRRAMINRMAEDIAGDKSITVSNEEVDQALDDLIESIPGANEKTIADTAESFYGTDVEGIRYMLRNDLLRTKVGIALDEESLERARGLRAKAVSGGDFANLAKNSSDDEVSKGSGGLIAKLKRDSQDYSDSFKGQAFGLEAGGVSDVFQSWIRPDVATKSVPVYHIIKVEKHIDADTLRARHIMVRISDTEKGLSDRLQLLIDEDKVSDSLDITNPS